MTLVMLLQVKLVEAELETGDRTLLLALSTSSEDPVLDLEACSVISSDQNEELMLSDSEELVVTLAMAKLNLDWPDEKKQVLRSKLDDCYLTFGAEQPSR